MKINDIEVGMDGVKWAQAFMQIWGHRLNEVEEDLMVGWFANAIMAGYDEGRKVPVLAGEGEDHA